MNLLYRDVITETSQDVFYEITRNEEMYYGTAIQYLGRYIWKLEGFLPEKDGQIWDMFRGHMRGYFASIRIRDASIGVGKELNRNFLIGKREKTNYAALDYIRRMQLLDNDRGEIEGILIACKGVRISD